jgi:hypothetical protein
VLDVPAGYLYQMLNQTTSSEKRAAIIPAAKKIRAKTRAYIQLSSFHHSLNDFSVALQTTREYEHANQQNGKNVSQKCGGWTQRQRA